MKRILTSLMFSFFIFLTGTAHAALATYSGSFLTNTSTGNQSVTGVGFTPKVILFYGAAKADSQGSYDGARQGIGAAVSSSAQWAHSIQYNWTSGSSASQTGKLLTTTKCFSYVTATSASAVTTTLDASFVSQDSDGFTVNITTTDGTARRIFYVALGGSDLSATVGSFNSGTTTGSSSVTGVGFQPDLLLVAASDTTTSADTSSTNSVISFGAGKSSSSRFSSNWLALANVTTTNVKSNQIATKLISRISSTGTIAMDADLVSMDSDGFTYNVTTNDAVARKFTYIALKGIQSKIGSTLQRTSVGTTAVTGIGFIPKLIITSTLNNTSSASFTTGGGLSLGMATGTSARRTSCIDALGANSGNHVQGFTSESLLISHCRGTGTTADATHPTVLGQADLASLDADGFTLNWTSTDGVERETYYIAIGESTGSSSGSTGVMYLF